MNNVLFFYIAGSRFASEKDLATLKNGDVLKLEAEPDNQYNENAIKIQILSGAHLGYVPRKLTKTLHDYRICKIPLLITLVNFIPEMPSWKQLFVTVQSKKELPKFIPEVKEKDEFQDFICLDKVDEEKQT